MYNLTDIKDHTFEVEPHGNVDHVAGSQEVQTQDLIYYHLACDREQHSAWELFSYREDSNEAAFAVAAVDKIYAHESLTFDDTVACEAEIWATKGLLDKEMGNVFGMEIVGDQSDNTLRVSQYRLYNEKLVQTLLERHSILSLEGSLSGDCDVEKNGKSSCIYAVGSQAYQMACTRFDIAYADVSMLDKFDRGLQINIPCCKILQQTRKQTMRNPNLVKKTDTHTQLKEVTHTYGVGVMLLGALTWDVSRKGATYVTRGSDDDKVEHEMCRGGICWHGVAVKSSVSELRFRLPQRQQIHGL
nr:zinc finger, CCHC-type [Tanacetum cinerariifolium]